MKQGYQRQSALRQLLMTFTDFLDTSASINHPDLAVSRSEWYLQPSTLSILRPKPKRTSQNGSNRYSHHLCGHSCRLCYGVTLLPPQFVATTKADIPRSKDHSSHNCCLNTPEGWRLRNDWTRMVCEETYGSVVSRVPV